MNPLILASESPRRQRLLREAGVAFEVAIPRVEERLHPGEKPVDAALRLAYEKAAAVRARHITSRVLAADTIVVLDDSILGKPTSPADAARMLACLSGRRHHVITGVALLSPERTETFAVTTEVLFRSLRREEIDAYVSTGEPMDKAGAYGIQGRAAGFVLAISGSYTNVVGLPLAECLQRLSSTASG